MKPLHFIQQQLNKHYIQGLIVSLLMLSVAIYGGIYWLTNDDVAMMQIVNGSGLAAYPSPGIVFSNVLWGYITATLPTFDFIYGYGLATLIVLTIASTSLFWSCRQMDIHIVISACLAIAVFTVPIVTPQFTITAGITTLIGVSLLTLKRKNKEEFTYPILIAAALLTFTGFIIRPESAIIMSVILCPLLPWKALFQSKKAWHCLGGFIVLIATALILNHFYYQSSEWMLFNDVQPLRARINDFKGIDQLLANPEILKKHGYSINDVRMISYWFLFDLNLVGPERLTALTSELAPPVVENFSTDIIKRGFSYVTKDPILKIFLISAAIISCLKARPIIILSWVILIATIAYISLLGRPTLFRVYYPLVVAIFVSACLLKPRFEKFLTIRVFAVNLIIIFSAITIVKIYVPKKWELAESHRATAIIYTNANIEDGVVIQGSSLPFEALYPLIDLKNKGYKLSMRGLGALTLTPYSNSKATTKDGSTIIDDFLGDGFDYLHKGDLTIKALTTYCREHFSGDLDVTEERQISVSDLSHVKCITREILDEKDEAI